MTRQEIVDLLRPEVQRMRLPFPVHLWFYIAFLAAVSWVDVANLFAYRANPLLLTVQAAVTVLTLAILLYGFRAPGGPRARASGRRPRLDRAPSIALL